MHAITIYGTPEDQLEVEGEFTEELSLYEFEDSAYLAFSDGTLLAVNLDEEETWRIEPITLGADTVIEKVEGTAETGTDKVTLANPDTAFRWILIGSSLVIDQ